MKRIAGCLFVGVLAVSLTGCCYNPGYISPYTGIPYGGSWEPVCGGPLDPLGFWCAVNYGVFGYGNPYVGSSYPAYSSYGVPFPAVSGAGMAGCNDGCEVFSGPCNTCSAMGAAMPQQPCGQGGPCHSAPKSGGSLKPVPDPMTSPTPQPAPGTSTTWVTPARRYVAPVSAVPTPLPTAQPGMMPTAPTTAPGGPQSASQQLWIQAY